MNEKRWIKNFIILTAAVTAGVCVYTAVLDPFFHYHAPLPGFYYKLENQRAQNDGITKHFDYDSLITGTSFTENFHTTQFDSLFDASSVKVPYPGASYREVNDNLKTAFRTHSGIRFVLRSVEDSYLIEDKDTLHKEMGEYPTYLYNRNPFDDLKYLLNKDVIAGYCLPMTARRLLNGKGGVDSFDSYSAAPETADGQEKALRELSDYRKELRGTPGSVPQEELTAEEAEMVKENVSQNLVSIAKAHPDTQFYYFVPPVSIARWGTMYAQGILYKQIQAQELAFSLLLSCDNVQLYSFAEDTALCTDFSHYADSVHYNAETAGELMRRIHAGEGRVTKENLRELLDFEKSFYGSYDYAALLAPSLNTTSR